MIKGNYYVQARLVLIAFDTQFLKLVRDLEIDKIMYQRYIYDLDLTAKVLKKGMIYDAATLPVGELLIIPVMTMECDDDE